MAGPLNVLLITTDQMRRDHMGCAGNVVSKSRSSRFGAPPVIGTPGLDRLAAGGICLDRAYVNNPVCMPNRATIATGRLPRNHRCWCNGVDLPECERTIADILNEHGYHTAFFGKPHFRITAMPFDGVPRGIECGPAWEQGVNSPEWTGPYYGFQYVQISVGHGHANLNRAHFCEWVKAKFPSALDKQFQFEPSPTGAFESFTPLYPHQAHSSNWLGEIGSEYLRQRAADGRPFLLWVSFPDPHHPFSPPKPYDTMYDPAEIVIPRLGPEALADKPPHFRAALRDTTEAQLREIIARTYGMVAMVDENVGRLLDVLDQTPLAANTIVIFTSDHGDLMGDCGLLLKGPWLLEGLINVPMLWRVPGGAAGARSDGLFSSCDVAPTILASRRDAAFVEYRTPEGDNLRTIITPSRKLTCYGGQDYGELYDMTADVPEARNLYASKACAEDLRALERRLLQELILREDERLWPTAGA
ncbi:MAG: hypothetical protein AMJ81_04685 [Phycisphaerae bacterium SM23_33]|nr:MAG: hypothetical protein AMJ81_04685 [Phycisphaerae bacterium SM23_33]